jgi:hypothetical protein
MHAAASVNAITKSGTNSLHRQRASSFCRDHRSECEELFCGSVKDGKRQDDGAAGAISSAATDGRPIARDRLFFFGGYQGTALRFRPSTRLRSCQRRRCMNGDFTAFASPSCNGGRQVNLGGGFVGNRIDPALFSPAGLKLARRLPTATDPCGQITYQTKDDSNEGQGIGRIDYR